MKTLLRNTILAALATGAISGGIAAGAGTASAAPAATYVYADPGVCVAIQRNAVLRVEQAIAWRRYQIAHLKPGEMLPNYIGVWPSYTPCRRTGNLYTFEKWYVS